MELNKSDQFTPTTTQLQSGKDYYTSKSVRHKQGWCNKKTFVKQDDVLQTPFEPKALIFIVGGLTSSEARIISEQGKGQLLLGSNFFLTPSGFLIGLTEYHNISIKE